MKISDKLIDALQNSLRNNIIDVVNEYLINGDVPAVLVFSPTGETEETVVAVLVLDMSKEETYKFSDLERLTDKLLESYTSDDVICAILRDKTLKSVDFYLGKFISSFEACSREYKDVIANEHVLFLLGTTESFKFDAGRENILHASSKL